MADKTIDELVAASDIYVDDLLVVQQSKTAKKLPGQVLINFLTRVADGHGGIQSIVPLSSSGLVDTYRITFADTTTFDFEVTNGRSIVEWEKTSTVGLVDTYTLTYNDNTTDTFSVTNGAKGDKGDTSHTWIRWASQMPTEASHDFGVIPDDYMGITSNFNATAPTDWQAYQWVKVKGEQGEDGIPATLLSWKTEYQSSSSGEVQPSGTWTEQIPTIQQGTYLWTRTTKIYNSGSPVVEYTVGYIGKDGSVRFEDLTDEQKNEIRGGYYTPSIDQEDASEVVLSFTPSETNMPTVDPVTITLPPGPTGPVGPSGSDGYTPVRGTDYWTAADRQAIVDATIAALPDATEVSY